MVFKIQTFLICIIFTLSFNVLNAQEKDTPRNGEGISTFLQRHHLGGRANEKKFIELNKKRLGKNNELLLGIKYTLPSKASVSTENKEAISDEDNESEVLPENEKASRKKGSSKTIKSTPNYEPLFGKELANYKVTSNELKGACFYVVSGHGGPDPGAIGWIGDNEVHAGVMEFNGDVYACDHFVFPEYKLGNIYHQTITEMMYSEKQLKFGADKYDKLPKQCKDCEFLFACNGECPKNRFIQTVDGEPGLNYLCRGYKKFFEHALS